MHIIEGYLPVSHALGWTAVSVPKSWSVTFCPTAAANALRTALRAWATVSVTLLFAFAAPVVQFIALLQRLRTRTALLELIRLTYRWIFLLDEACASIVGAQRNRLGYLDVPTALRSSGQAVAALLARTLSQSLRLERGLCARGYNGTLAVLLPPTSTRSQHLLLAMLAPALLGGISWLGAWYWSLQ